MRSLRIYIVLLALGCILGGKLSAANASPLPEPSPVQATVQAFAVPDLQYSFPCEKSLAIDAANFTQISFSIDTKDLHSYAPDPFTKNDRIESLIVSYLFFNQTFPSSESLSRLGRFNI